MLCVHGPDLFVPQGELPLRYSSGTSLAACPSAAEAAAEKTWDDFTSSQHSRWAICPLRWTVKFAFNIHMFWQNAKDSQQQQPEECHWCFLGVWKVDRICALELSLSLIPVFLGQVTWPLWAYLLTWEILIILAFYYCERQEIMHQIFVYNKYLISIHLLCLHHVLSEAPNLNSWLPFICYS